MFVSICNYLIIVIFSNWQSNILCLSGSKKYGSISSSLQLEIGVITFYFTVLPGLMGTHETI
jgi:hypothetical protein